MQRMLQNCFTLPMLIFIQSTWIPGIFISLLYNMFNKKIQLLVGESYMFGNVIIWYVQ